MSYVKLESGERRVLFVIWKNDGHTYQLTWEPGYEYCIESQLERWVDDVELDFDVDDMLVMIEAAIEICKRHNANVIAQYLDDTEGQDEW